MLVDYGENIRLVDIALLPKFRKQGYGSAAIRELFELGKPVTLHVSIDNPARNLYERLGFVEVARDEVYAEMRRESPRSREL
jgi:ribosomal protein S18 acetylase RimI-like enzyme